MPDELLAVYTSFGRNLIAELRAEGVLDGPDHDVAEQITRSLDPEFIAFLCSAEGRDALSGVLSEQYKVLTGLSNALEAAEASVDPDLPSPQGDIIVSFAENAPYILAAMGIIGVFFKITIKTSRGEIVFPNPDFMKAFVESNSLSKIIDVWKRK